LQVIRVYFSATYRGYLQSITETLSDQFSSC
jgi:hypothetical protein